MSPMKQSGRVSILMLASIVSVVFITAILLFSKESVSSVGTRFLDALERHDVDTLTKMSMMSGTSPEQIHKEWDQCVNHAGKYYTFAYHVEGASQSGDNLGSVRFRLIKDADRPGAYDEAVELPMVKVDGEWKVDVRSMSHELFPGLPR